jgi:hypothetical protein
MVTKANIYRFCGRAIPDSGGDKIKGLNLFSPYRTTEGHWFQAVLSDLK